jgi:hypothetical protein
LDEERSAMPLSAPYTVVVKMPVGTPIGEAMNTFRTWLDGEKIQPREFKIDAGRRDLTFALGFGSVAEAERFRAEFVTRLPTERAA